MIKYILCLVNLVAYKLLLEKIIGMHFYLYCTLNSLNLAVCDGSKLTTIHNCLSIIEKFYAFFNRAEYKTVVQDIITGTDEINSNVKLLKRSNLNRWISIINKSKKLYINKKSI